MRAFGRFKVGAVDAGRIRLDAGAVFGVVPRALWSKHFTADDQNRVTLALRSLLIVDESGSETRRILVDTGIGDKLDAKVAEQLGLEAPEGGLRQAVRRAGVDPDEITDVILTHLHIDHAGGATLVGAGGEIEPTFPGATYHLQRRAYKWAQHPSERDTRSFRQADYASLASLGNLHLFDGPQDLFDGLSLILSEGHTVGQQLPLLDGDDDGKLLFCADIIPTRAHVRLPWIMSFDLYPLTTLEEKRLLLAQGVAEDWTLFLAHDPDVAACKLTEQEGEVIAGEAVAL
ncbi:MAG: MBL fold metallo-hydrolase [Myxococcota bacterium]